MSDATWEQGMAALVAIEPLAKPPQPVMQGALFPTSRKRARGGSTSHMVQREEKPPSKRAQRIKKHIAAREHAKLDREWWQRVQREL